MSDYGYAAAEEINHVSPKQLCRKVNNLMGEPQPISTTFGKVLNPWK